MKPGTQEYMVLEHLKAGNSISPLEALQCFGCFRLGARVFELRKLGYDICSEMVSHNGKHFKRYWLNFSEPITSSIVLGH